MIPIDPGIFASEIERLTLQNTRVMLLRDQDEDEDQLLLEVDLDLKRDGSLRELQLSARAEVISQLMRLDQVLATPLIFAVSKEISKGRLLQLTLQQWLGFLIYRFLGAGYSFLD